MVPNHCSIQGPKVIPEQAFINSYPPKILEYFDVDRRQSWPFSTGQHRPRKPLWRWRRPSTVNVYIIKMCIFKFWIFFFKILTFWGTFVKNTCSINNELPSYIPSSSSSSLYQPLHTFNQHQHFPMPFPQASNPIQWVHNHHAGKS